MDPISDLKAAMPVLPPATAAEMKGSAVPGNAAAASFKAEVAAADPSVASAKAPSRQQEAIREFTAVITSQFVGEILKVQQGLVQGEGADSEFYHSMLVNAISETLAESDAFGIAAVLERDIK